MRHILTLSLILITIVVVMTAANASTPNELNSLYTEPTFDSLYVRAGETVEVVLKQANMSPVVGYQAFLSFDTNILQFQSAAYTAAPYDMYVVDPMVSSGGNLNLAAGRIGASSADADLARLIFTVPIGTPDCTTQVTFRQSERPTTFADANGDVVAPSLGSFPVVIDSTLPGVSIDSIVQGTTDLLSGSPNALQGAVTITVNASDAAPTSGLVTPPVVKVKDAVNVDTTLTASGSGPWTYSYPVTAATANGAATITASVLDNAGNLGSTTRTFNINKTTATVNLQLLGVYEPSIERTITIVIGGLGGSIAPVTFRPRVTFTNGRGEVILRNLPHNGAWIRISAKDEQHTLRSTVDLLDPTGKLQYQANLALIGGDATNDNLIDIQDFGVFSGQYGTSGHPFAGRDADFSCDGSIWSEEYTFIHISFLKFGSAPPTGAPVGVNAASTGNAVPKTSVTVAEFSKIVGIPAAVKADINGDGVIDMSDVKLFMQKQMSIPGAVK